MDPNIDNLKNDINRLYNKLEKLTIDHFKQLAGEINALKDLLETIDPHWDGKKKHDVFHTGRQKSRIIIPKDSLKFTNSNKS